MDRLAAMEVFVRVVDTGSFSGAARQLRVGQPAVSKTVAQLEARLGVKLLLRTTHGLTATEAGERFYADARRSIAAADEAELSARGAGAGLAGRLRFCAAVSFARLHVVPRLAAFMQAHPGLEIEAILDDRNVDLVEAGVDVALRMGDLPDSSLTARKIGRSPRVVVGAPAYFASAGTPRVPADLAGHQTVVYQQGGGGAVWRFTRAGGEAETEVTVGGRIRLTAAEGVREAVFAGLGLAVASQWMFAPEIASGRVIQVLQEWSPPPVDLWAVFPTGRQASLKARAFVDFIAAELAAADAG